MKIAVLSFSGNVGKSTIARHLFAPRLPGAKLIAIESVNDREGKTQTIRGSQFADLQEFLQIVDDVIVDIGASNIEDLLTLMRRYKGSHEDIDVFVIPAVPAAKQQRDTIATLAELSRLGIPADKVRVIFNMVEDDSDLDRIFEPLLSFLQLNPMARVSMDCRLGFNEIYGRMNGQDIDLTAVAADPTDYKAQIKSATDAATRLALAQRLANQRLARGVVPELNVCFAALELDIASTARHEAT